MRNENFERAVATLKNKGEFSSYTSGTSMSPLFKTHRDVIVIKEITSPLKKYDIPLYTVPTKKELILHRIVKVLPNGTYVIRGDNTYNNEYVPKENIAGVLKEFYIAGHYHSCEEFWFKLYSRMIVFTYPVRRLWVWNLRPFLSKVKRFLLGLFKK